MHISIPSPAPTALRPTNHVMVVDVSGSMSDTLPKLRTDLKNKITTLVKPGDLLTIIYFSGNGTAGFVFEHKLVSSPVDLIDVKAAIDRYLIPLGMTAFCKPLYLATQAIRPDMYNSLVFLTDGYNNDCSVMEIYTALDVIRNKFDATYFIEYGYYVDSDLISDMASRTDGVALTAEGFVELSLTIETGLRSVLAPKIEVEIESSWAVGYGGGQLVLYRTDSLQKIYVNADCEWIVFGERTHDMDNDHILALAWGYFAVGDIGHCEQSLIWVGDVGLINAFVYAYGKQKINAFKQMLLDTIRGDRKYYTNGQNMHYVIDPTAFTVMDMLDSLSRGDNLVYLNHPAFSYKRISAKREQSGVDSALLAELAEVVGDDTAADVLGKPSMLFEATDKIAGVPFNSISFNTSRANVNFSVSIPGRVTGIPSNEWGIIEHPSKIIRTYNIVKDGVLNVSSLAVKLDDETKNHLLANGLSIETEEWNDVEVHIINFGDLPVINRQMLKSITMEAAAIDVVNLEAQRAATKVFKYMKVTIDAEQPIVSDDDRRNNWLSSIGIKEYGFAPPTVKSESTDMYYAPQLVAKIKGLSTLPPVESAIKKRDDGKMLSLGDRMVLDAVDLYTGILENVLDEKISEITTQITQASLKRKRELEYELSKTVMSIILGRRWFTDRTGYDDNVIVINHPKYGEVQVTFEYNDIAIKI